MPSTKHSKLTIKNISKDYKYREWLDSVLKTPNPTLDYFSFARTFRGSKNATNNHYSDLLEKLKNNQSNKLMAIAKKAEHLYSLRNSDNCEFGQKYRDFWEERDNIRYKEIVQHQNRSTVIRLNRLTNYNIQQLAEKVYIDMELQWIFSFLRFQSAEASQANGPIEEDGENETLEEVSEEGGESEEPEREEDTDIEDDTRVVLRQSSDLPSNEVGHLEIIDLSSTATVEILKSETSPEKFNSIIAIANIDPIVLSDYALELINVFKTTAFSFQSLRETLYTNGFRKYFDLILHHDASFIEVTTRHFLDLMCSPKNPLTQNILERTTATYVVIHIVNQLFIANNDIIELGWLERELCATGKAKWDGVLFKGGNKSISPVLIEFSGGCTDKNLSIKNQNDISKLYSNMSQILKTLPSVEIAQMFCIRYYDKYVYFEKLSMYNSMMFRSLHATIEVPTTPRTLVAYIQNVPKILAWKQAVIDHTLQLN